VGESWKKIRRNSPSPLAYNNLNKALGFYKLDAYGVNLIGRKMTDLTLSLT